MRAGALYGYLGGVIFYAGNCYWIYQTMYLYGGLPKPVALLILFLFALYLGLYHALFAGLLVSVRKRISGWAVGLFAGCAWVAVELARSRITSFPWDLLGYAQIDNGLVMRLVPVTGVMGVSLVVALVNGMLAWGWTHRTVRGAKLSLFALSAAVVCLIAAGMLVRPVLTPAERAGSSVTLLQENLEVGAVGKGIPVASLAKELDSFIGASGTPVDLRTDPAVRGEAIALVVWPEAPSHLQSNDLNMMTRLGGMARTLHAPVIAGMLGVDVSNASERGYFLYDSAQWLDAEGAAQGRYDKIHLVPWGEFIPYPELFSFAHKLTEGAGSMDRGSQRNNFVTGGHGYGTFVCYESIFGDEVRDFVRGGAEVLVNISDDGWYGDTGAPWQHLNMARMRAIENHRWVLRATNTGVTTAIDPQGRMAAEAPRHVRGAYTFGFGYLQDVTFYTRYGDWLAWVCAALTLAAVAFGALRK